MAEGKFKNCADCLHNAVCSIWRENECQDASLYHENGECFYGWTSVKDEMPPEHDSMFKNFKGTKKWIDGMFETISDTVIVSVKFEDGTRKTIVPNAAQRWTQKARKMMAEYIDKSFVLYVIHHFGNMQTWSKKDIVSECVRKITSEKAADVVPVVRCKSCIYGESDGVLDGYRWCSRFDNIVGENDFCSHGAKKDLEEQTV